MELKNFTKRVDLNNIFSKTNSCKNVVLPNEIFPLSYKLRQSYYQLLKNLKLQKKSYCGLKIYEEVDLGRKFQTNNFYLSLVESTKKVRVKALKSKIDSFLSKGQFFTTFQEHHSILHTLFSRKTKKKNYGALTRGFDKFEKFYGFSSKSLDSRRALLEKLKIKNIESGMFSRFFLYTSLKKYKKNFFYLYKRKRKLSSLFQLFSLSSLKFKSSNAQRKSLLKKWVWKMKKRKKWHSSSLANFQSPLKELSIPNHFEINYKTFSFVYLGYTDFRTVNAKIPFWLNLRRLLTFMIK